MNEVAEEEN